jgi:hypothetical protein
MHNDVVIFSSWFTLVCRSLLVVRVRVNKDNVVVTFVEIKNELLFGYHLVVLGKSSPSRTTKVHLIYLVGRLNPELLCWHYPVD